ncbi:protein of unknown function [Xenorhabdus bovienii]|uniref:Uncharacterized protein n=1 Tax=Xenorhabdus bovienii TaxID=40576 RepID=A0A0B6X3Y6_XENBV|nr:protein of unknown function [Xenorhabdus bovienii]
MKIFHCVLDFKLETDSSIYNNVGIAFSL